MAGRPAVSRGGGLTGLHYGLIVQVILFVLALAAAIWLGTMVKGAQERQARAERKNAQFGSPPSYYEQEAQSRGSQVATVANETLSPGTYRADFNTAGLPPGVYHYTLSAGGKVLTRSMVVRK